MAWRRSRSCETARRGDRAVEIVGGLAAGDMILTDAGRRPRSPASSPIEATAVGQAASSHGRCRRETAEPKPDDPRRTMRNRRCRCGILIR